MKDLKHASATSALILGSLFTASALASEVIEERKVLVDDRYGGQHQVTQKVLDRGAGFHTYIQGKRPEKLQEIHKDICQSVGGKDVFDETTIVASDSVQDVTVCRITDPKAMADRASRGTTYSFSAGKQTESDPIQIASTLYWPPAMSLTPPNRDVPVDQNYRISGDIEYYTEDSGYYNAHMQADRCQISTYGAVGELSRGSIYISVLCISNEPGTWPVYLNASIPGLSAMAVGEIRAH